MTKLALEDAVLGERTSYLYYFLDYRQVKMLSRQSEPADARPTRAWPADQVERWRIEQLTPYANNAWLHSEACTRRSYQERARTHVLAQRRIRSIVRFCTWGKEQREIKEIERVRCRAVHLRIDMASHEHQPQSRHQVCDRAGSDVPQQRRRDDAFDKVPF